MDQELKVFLEEQLAQAKQQMAERFVQDLRLIAQGVMGLNERLERLAVFQEAIETNFKKTEALIPPYCQELDDRVRVLEARAERQTKDAIEAILQKFGKPQGS